MKHTTTTMAVAFSQKRTVSQSNRTNFTMEFKSLRHVINN